MQCNVQQLICFCVTVVLLRLLHSPARLQRQPHHRHAYLAISCSSLLPCVQLPLWVVSHAAVCMLYPQSPTAKHGQILTVEHAVFIFTVLTVNLPFHHKVQKFSSGTGSPGWSRKKVRKTVVVWLQLNVELTKLDTKNQKRKLQESDF